ncbi:MAG: hypothetical protein WCT54_05300, partial [Patescibacteria group bacterium]
AAWYGPSCIIIQKPIIVPPRLKTRLISLSWILLAHLCQKNLCFCLDPVVEEVTCQVRSFVLF